jgi:hypothetical protein
MTNDELVAIELDDDERELMFLALNEYGGPAKHAYQLLCPLFGLSNEDGWYQLVIRLKRSHPKQPTAVGS